MSGFITEGVVTQVTGLGVETGELLVEPTQDWVFKAAGGKYLIWKKDNPEAAVPEVFLTSTKVSTRKNVFPDSLLVSLRGRRVRLHVADKGVPNLAQIDLL